MSTSMQRGMIVCAVLVAALAATTAQAQSWLGVQDAAGRTWARVKFVNLSAEASNWAVWNCRTAVDSTADSADTDAQADWDGRVEAGTVEYVWVYGLLAGEVNFDNADGGASTFNGAAAPSTVGDSELVITINADGSVSASAEPVSPYSVPSLSGTLPDTQ